jgi:transketolase
LKTQRDEFIEKLFVEAKKDSSIIFISVDMGAPALDQWREELPNQFIVAGISEQNAINLAAGLSRAGKKPYVYMMACWVARCFEQIRYSCAMAQNPITILGAGVGLGYAPAGPAHEPTEDLAYMRAIESIEIFSPSSLGLIQPIVNLTINVPKLRYVRLERIVSEYVSNHKSNSTYSEVIDLGNQIFKENSISKENSKVTILTSGYLLQRAYDASLILEKKYGIGIQIIDVIKIKPLNIDFIINRMNGSNFLVTIEEQAISAAFGAAIIEGLSDRQFQIYTLRLGLKTAYVFENGTRDQLLDNNGLGVVHIVQRIKEFVETQRNVVK